MPEQDISCWQGLLIYLPIGGLSAIIFALTALETSAAGVFPRITPSGAGAVGMVAAGGIHVTVTTVLVMRHGGDQTVSDKGRILEHEQPTSPGGERPPLLPYSGS